MDKHRTDINVLKDKTITEASFWRNEEDKSMTFEFITDKDECFSITVKSHPLVDIAATKTISKRRSKDLYSHDEIAPNEDTIFEL